MKLLRVGDVSRVRFASHRPKWFRLLTLWTLVLLGVVIGPTALAPPVLAASARTRVSVQASAVVFVGSRVRVAGVVSGGHGSYAAVLVRRRRGRWEVEGRARLRRGRFALTWQAPKAPTTIVLRTEARSRAGRLLGASRPFRVRAEWRSMALPDKTVVSAPSGHPGRVVLHARLRRGGSAAAAGGGCITLQDAPKAGQPVVVPPSPQSPYGALTKRVGGIRFDGPCQLSYETVPATIPELVGNSGASLDYGSLRNVSTGRSASSGTSFQHDWKDVRCSGGGVGSVSGSLDLGVKPELHASFSPVGGLSSASFSVTGTATASLRADVRGSAQCSLHRQLMAPKDIATFRGTIGGWPIWVTLRGSLDATGSLSATADTSAGITAAESVTGGVGYGTPTGGCSHAGSDGFYPIWCGPTTSPFTYNPPTVAADAHAGAEIAPRLQALLYGAAGPQITLTTGLALDADAQGWKLTAPLDLDGSLVAPILGLDRKTGDIALHHWVPFPLATGRFGAATGASVTITHPGDQAGAVGTAVNLPVHATDTDGGTLSYSATGLPAGLSIDPARGLITGTPTTAGSWTVTVRATDSTGPSSSISIAWTVAAGGVPPEHDRPSVNTPQVAPAVWTAPMGDAGMILPARDGSVITTKCSFHSATDGDVPYALQQLAPDGALDWRRGSDSADCGGNIRDAAGNDYYFMTDMTGAHIRSVDPRGQVRWTTAPLPHGIDRVYYATPTLGANDVVYFAVYNGYGAADLIGISEGTGDLTVDTNLGFPLALYAYADGLVVADGSSTVDYLRYDGSTRATYNVPDIDFTGASFAAGAGGAIFAAGTSQASACVDAVPFRVTKVTPSGVAWDWVDGDARCSTRGYAAATPDGGVVTTEWSGSGASTGYVESLDGTGSERWRTPLAATAHGLLFAATPVVDDHGLVAIPRYTEYTCNSNPADTCIGLQVAFASEAASANSLPAVNATNESSTISSGGGPWGGHVALARNRVYVDATPYLDNNTYATDGDALVALDAPGLSDDYRLDLQLG